MSQSHASDHAGRIKRWLFESLPRTFRHLWGQRIHGQGLVEYALVLVLIAIVVIGSLTMVGRRTSSTFDQVNCNLAGGTYHRDNGNGNSNRCN